MQATSDHLAILVIEDNPADFCLIERMLRVTNIRIEQIYSASHITEAFDLIQKNRIDLILLDLSLPDSFGIDSFLRLKPAVQNIPVIILTGLSESKVTFEALQQGAQDYLVKNEFNTDLLNKSIQYSIERKTAEKKISLSEEKYRQMFYKNPFPAWIHDPVSLQILEVNDAASRKYGYERKEFLTLTLRNIWLTEKSPQPGHVFTIRSEPGAIHNKLCRHKKKNGEIILAEMASYEIDYCGKIAMQVQINDITEKLRLEKELEVQQKLKQQQIAEAVLGAHEEERKSLGEELHDNINQILATAKLYLNAGLQDKKLLQGFVAQSQDYIVMAMEEIRKLSRKLIAPAYIESGLKQAVENMLKDIRVAKKISIVTDLVAVEDIRLSRQLKITVYRIIQEQLNNILKHAEASRIVISIKVEKDTLVLLVADDGKGFDTTTPGKGIGLLNMQSRAELCNGKLAINSSPGNGCRLKAELPVQTEKTKKVA